MICTEKESEDKVCPACGDRICSGSDCMAWVWVKWKRVDSIREFSQKTEGCEPYKGKCGMVNYG